MLIWMAICASAVLALLGAWYEWVRRRNRLKSLDVLQWINLALRGEGHVTGIRWLSASRFVVPLRLRSHIFRRPSVLVELVRRELPVSWMRDRIAGRTDALTFQADLDGKPNFSFEVVTHRWCAGSHRRLPKDPSRWELERSDPVVFATRKWPREVGSRINALFSSRQQELIGLRFGRKSPQFCATVPLESIAPGAGAQPGVFTVLREIAAEASAQ